MKLVINNCFGGFGLSKKAHAWLDTNNTPDRDDPRLVECIQTLGEKANGPFAELDIVEIPDGVTDWEITEYDGAEAVIYVLNGKIHHA